LESDSIRSSGSNTLVDIWIDGKVRAISVTREAIDAFVGFERGAKMTDDERCEFIRTHLSQLLSAVKTKLAKTILGADLVVIEAGELGGRGADRRKVDRRKGDRRKADRPSTELPHGERRRGARRQGDRRRSAKRKDS
jgi:hypothetical protein